MFRVLPLGLALAAALLLSACGGSNPKLIPQDRADRLSSLADLIAQRTDDHDCSGAQAALRRARNEVSSELPRSVDRRLKANMVKWLDQIGSRIPADCKPKASPSPTETQSAAPTATPSPAPTPTPSPSPSPTPSPSPSATATPSPAGKSPVTPPNPTGGVQPPSTGGVDAGNGNG